MKSAIILGAGIQGVCCAYALHDNGYDVTLVEKADKVFNRTSLNQEGRIHLGFTYGLDKTRKTGSSVMSAALGFSSILEEWFGKVDWDKITLDKGYYVVHKNESLLHADEIENYYNYLQDLYDEQIQNSEKKSYFGNKPKKLFKRLDKIPDHYSEDQIGHAFLTEETIVEMFHFRDLVIENLKRRKIKVLTSTEALGTERLDRGFSVEVLNSKNERERLKADIVVNCLWNNRIKHDKTIGVSTLHEPLYRFKVGLFGKVTAPVYNTSIISGAFGNISPRMDGTYAYISWHPDCMIELTKDGTTPTHWDEFMENPDNSHFSKEWVKNTIIELSKFMPSVSTFKPTKLLPGIIVSAGKSDISDKNSNVHKRGEHIGVHEFDGYYSMDTGKFSTAPMFAKELLEKIQNAV